MLRPPRNSFESVACFLFETLSLDFGLEPELPADIHAAILPGDAKDNVVRLLIMEDVRDTGLLLAKTHLHGL